MKLRTFLLLAFFVLALAVSALAPQNQTFGRCTVTIPADWGTYRGDAQGYGLVFEDSDGTLRFVKQLPCGLEGQPNVLVEVRRR